MVYFRGTWVFKAGMNYTVTKIGLYEKSEVLETSWFHDENLQEIFDFDVVLLPADLLFTYWSVLHFYVTVPDL